jgi:hypothetical protein
MAWLIGIVVLVLLVISPGFRRLAGGLIALALMIGGIFYLKNEQEERQSLTRIKVSELDFESVTLSPNYSSYKLAGRIKNNSPKHTLKQVTFVVTMQDCAAQSQNCVTIGENKETTFLTIPPGQARDFQESVYFSGSRLNPKGHMEWQYTVSQIRGE